MAREGVPLIVIQRQLGHTNLGITSVYLQGIDNTEIIDTVHALRADGPPYTARSRRDAETGGGEADDFPRRRSSSRSPARNPGGASDPQSAPIIANQQRTRRQRPAPFAEGALTQRYSRVAQGGIRRSASASWVAAPSRRKR